MLANFSFFFFFCCCCCCCIRNVFLIQKFCCFQRRAPAQCIVIRPSRAIAHARRAQMDDRISRPVVPSLSPLLLPLSSGSYPITSAQLGCSSQPLARQHANTANAHRDRPRPSEHDARPPDPSRSFRSIPMHGLGASRQRLLLASTHPHPRRRPRETTSGRAGSSRLCSRDKDARAPGVRGLNRRGRGEGDGTNPPDRRPTGERSSSSPWPPRRQQVLREKGRPRRHDNPSSRVAADPRVIRPDNRDVTCERVCAARAAAGFLIGLLIPPLNNWTAGPG